ncbi:unnamed protein product [Protopolystoma xenopodis]|uniref:Uncharacterized protein n=1 Tax=Protopolystoma xenopodis TaxID=117903 RepID=A0A3S5AMU7_9PLAT|nr:unnamed protein product [Protopolystoma xenopodis]
MARLTEDTEYDAGEASGSYHVYGPTLEIIMHTMDSGKVHSSNSIAYFHLESKSLVKRFLETQLFFALL